MTARRRRRRNRGQSVVEMALLLPLLVVITLGATDLAQAYRFGDDVAGASRAGMRVGVFTDTTDIGSSVRGEPNSVIPDTVAAWGLTGPGQAYDKCTNSAGPCGDPNGCVPSSFAAGQTACFAIRACRLAGTANSQYACVSYDSYGTRPESTNMESGLQVVVVYKLTPITPLIGAVAGSGGAFYLTNATTGLEVYY